MIVRRIKNLRGLLRLPPDRVQAAVSLILAALSEGRSEISPWPLHGDFAYMLKWLEAAQIPFLHSDEILMVDGIGPRPPAAPRDSVPVGTSPQANLLGAVWLTSGVGSRVRFTGRPARLIRLRADLSALPGLRLEESGDGLVVERVAPPEPVDRELRRASPALRSSQLLCALVHGLPFRWREPYAAQDALENACGAFGVPLETVAVGMQELDEYQKRMLRRTKQRPERHVTWTLPAGAAPAPAKISLFSDPSLAAFLALLASRLPESSLELEQVAVTPSRCGFFTAFSRFDKDHGLLRRSRERDRHGESGANLYVSHAREFRGANFSAQQVRAVGDDFPLLAVSAAFADGESILRHGETRPKAIAPELACLLDDLRRAGVDAGQFDEGIVLRGREELDADKFVSEGDAPLALACAALACLAQGRSELDDPTLDALEELWPGWHATLEGLNDAE